MFSTIPNKNMGMVVPKISSSMARLHFSQEITKDLINRSVSIWENTYLYAAQTASLQLNRTAKEISLFPNARKLYFWLVDHYGYSVNIPKKEIYASKIFHVVELEEAVQNLLEKGALYAPDNNHVRLVEIYNSTQKP